MSVDQGALKASTSEVNPFQKCFFRNSQINSCYKITATEGLFLFQSHCQKPWEPGEPLGRAAQGVRVKHTFRGHL